MIPLRDSIPSRTTPVVNYAILAICTVVFLMQVANPEEALTEKFGMVPVRIQNPDAETVITQRVVVAHPDGRTSQQLIQHLVAPSSIVPWATVVTCMFLHGGWMHYLGNMWFLYIFGDNVEDRLGHVGYTLMYLGTGVIAGLAHWYSDMDSVIPTIGASGAIAGVMGAYAWLYPQAKVQAVLPLFIFIQVFVLPAPIFLGIWFAMQTFNGLMTSGQTGGVAWWAHIGGFVAGAVVALAIGRTAMGQEAVSERRF